MNKDIISEESRLIPEFMGYELVESKCKRGSYSYRIKSDNPKSRDGYVYSSIEYHKRYNKDWNLLMGVVKKIISADVYENVHSIFGIHRVSSIKTYLMNADIEGTYDSVIKFIMWYNTNKK